MSTASVKAAQKFADAIAKDEFLRDANVDLRGFPSMQPVEDSSFEDDRFAPLSGSGSQDAKDLRAFLQEQIDEGEGSSVVHVGENEFRVFYRDGEWHADGEANGKRRRYSAADKEALYGKLMKLAAASKKEAIRQLSEGQLTEVARVAQRDRVQAINLHLGYSFPENFAEENDAEEIVNNPRYANFLSSVTEFVWRNSRLDSTDSEDWQDFKTQFVGDRPLSCALLDYAWQEFCSSRNRLVFAEPPRDKEEAPAAPESLDDLSDDEITATYKGVARAFAQR